MLEKFAVRRGLAGLNGVIVGWPEIQPCMWLVGIASPLEGEAAFGKVGKLLILCLEDHMLFSVGSSCNQCFSSSTKCQECPKSCCQRASVSVIQILFSRNYFSTMCNRRCPSFSSDPVYT